MTTQQRKLRFKATFKNPLSEKLKIKKSKSIVKAAQSKRVQPKAI